LRPAEFTLAQMARWLAFGLALAVAPTLAGCASTSLAASETRVPVLLGPVPCIGCAAARPPIGPTFPVSGRGAEIVVGVLHGWDDAYQPGVSLDRVFYGTPCADDIRLAKVRARAWQLTIPILFYWSEASVDADATLVPSPGGTCTGP
jgi:hypothetical protein